MDSSYSWSKSDDKDEVNDKQEFTLLFKKAIKGWIISTTVFLCIFFLYQFFLVPSFKIVELLANNDTSTVQTHTILKSLVLVFFIISCLNTNIIAYFYLLAIKKDFTISKKNKRVVRIFSFIQVGLYFTIFLFIIAKHARTFLLAVLDESKK